MTSLHLILFDGDCGFCRRAVLWLESRDREGRFTAIPYQESPSPPMTPSLFKACARAVHVVRADGGILRGGRAVLFILEHTGMGILARVLAWPPSVWGVELGYWMVARNRPFFGRFLFRGRGSRT
jgi:predicted DCC family thiol-disulfide oxidoreductase YuxK